MKKIRWVIQENNYSVKDRNAIIDACNELGYAYLLVEIIPFSNELPHIPLDDEYENIYYGSTTMMERTYRDFKQPKGLFFDQDTFLMSRYLETWGQHMLSSEAKVSTFEQLVHQEIPLDKMLFIRPNDDSKLFEGKVLEFRKIKEWYQNIIEQKVEKIGTDTIVLAGPAYQIHKEWRNIVVDGKVVASSSYRKDFEPYFSATDIPDRMVEFVEKRCKEFMPHAIFAMDIALCGTEHEYYIIECGCANSIGFYECDIKEYVRSISAFISNS